MELLHLQKPLKAKDFMFVEVLNDLRYNVTEGGVFA